MRARVARSSASAGEAESIASPPPAWTGRAEAAASRSSSRVRPQPGGPVKITRPVSVRASAARRRASSRPAALAGSAGTALGRRPGTGDDGAAKCAPYALARMGEAAGRLRFVSSLSVDGSPTPLMILRKLRCRRPASAARHARRTKGRTRRYGGRATHHECGEHVRGAVGEGQRLLTRRRRGGGLPAGAALARRRRRPLEGREVDTGERPHRPPRGPHGRGRVHQGGHPVPLRPGRPRRRDRPRRPQARGAPGRLGHDPHDAADPGRRRGHDRRAAVLGPAAGPDRGRHARPPVDQHRHLRRGPRDAVRRAHGRRRRRRLP